MRGTKSLAALLVMGTLLAGAPQKKESERTPRKAGRALLVKDLARVIESMERRISVLEKRVKELEAENRGLKRELEALKAAPRKRRAVPEKKTEKAGKAEAGRGIRLGLLVSERPSGTGAASILVEDVEPGFVGEVAGLEPGDVILTFMGKKLKGVDGFSKLLAGIKTGAPVTLTFRKKDGTVYKAVVKCSHRRNESVLVKKERLSAKSSRKKVPAAGKKKEKPAAKAVPGVRRGLLGVICQADEKGELEVTAVLRGFPADRAGIVPGDVILEVDGKKVSDLDGLREALLAAVERGGKLVLTVRRESGKVEKIPVLRGKAGKKRAPAAREKRDRKQKAERKKPSSRKGAGFGIEVAEENGVLRITGVDRDGPSAGKLRAGDVIASFAGKEVKKLEDLRRIVSAVVPGKEVRITVYREGKTVTVRVVPAGK